MNEAEATVARFDSSCRRDWKGHAMGFAYAEDEAMEAGR